MQGVPPSTTYEFARAKTSSKVRFAIVANCLSQSAAGPVRGDPHLLYELSSPTPSLGRVAEGEHGLFARFMDDQCNVRAAGCQEVEIENGGDATLVVTLLGGASSLFLQESVF